MARWLVALALALLAVAALVAASPELRRRVRPGLERLGVLRAFQASDAYEARVERHRRENETLRAPCVLLLGDSLSEGFPVAERPGWIVRGISGDRVRHVAARLAPSALDAPCTEVALLAGSNDLVGDGATPSGVAAEVANLAERLRAAGKRVVVTTLPPVRGRYAAANGALRAANDGLRALAARGFVVLDLYAALAGADGEVEPRYSSDGLHLSPAGYERWAEALAAALATAAQNAK